MNKEKSILILGATSDISVAIAEKYASKGYGLILAARNLSELERIKKDINVKTTVEVEIEQFDALNFDSHSGFLKKLSVIPSTTACVFGYMGDHEGAINDWNMAHQIIDTNFTGAVSMLNLIANIYQEEKLGTIIGISSVAGDRGRQSNYLYGSAKAGFSAYLSGLRNRMNKYGVHVLTVKPGFVNTKMTEGLGLPGPITAEPKQVANDIYKAIKKGKNTLYTIWMWKYIMLIIKYIPEFIFKKLSL